MATTTTATQATTTARQATQATLMLKISVSRLHRLTLTSHPIGTTNLGVKTLRKHIKIKIESLNYTMFYHISIRK